MSLVRIMQNSDDYFCMWSFISFTTHFLSHKRQIGEHSKNENKSFSKLHNAIQYLIID